MSSTCLIFRYTLSLPSDMEWGHIDENGTWNGLIGALNDRVRLHTELYTHKYTQFFLQSRYSTKDVPM